MAITKEKFNNIQKAAKGRINADGGILYLDAVAKANKPAWRKIRQGYEGWLMLNHNITAATAKRHVAKASRRLRYPHLPVEDNWGGDRHSSTH